MTTPKIPTVHRNDSRLYQWDKKEVPGVTSVVGTLPKPFLQYWAAKVVAEEAVAVDMDALLRKRGPDGAIKYLKGTPNRDRDRAADMGSAVHDTLEHLALGEAFDVPEEQQGFISGYDQFCERFSPTWIKLEETVYGESPAGHGYAGSFDAITEISGENWLIDFKTTRSGVHPEVALQLAAYANAKSLIHPDGSTSEIPRIDRFGVLWLRPTEWSFVELNVTQSETDKMWETFCSLLDVWQWVNGGSKKALGAPLSSGAAAPRPF
jgi:hypothetical protein